MPEKKEYLPQTESPAEMYPGAPIVDVPAELNNTELQPLAEWLDVKQRILDKLDIKELPQKTIFVWDRSMGSYGEQFWPDQDALLGDEDFPLNEKGNRRRPEYTMSMDDYIKCTGKPWDGSDALKKKISIWERINLKQAEKLRQIKGMLDSGDLLTIFLTTGQGYDVLKREEENRSRYSDYDPYKIFQPGSKAKFATIIADGVGDYDSSPLNALPWENSEEGTAKTPGEKGEAIEQILTALSVPGHNFDKRMVRAYRRMYGLDAGAEGDLAKSFTYFNRGYFRHLPTDGGLCEGAHAVIDFYRKEDDHFGVTEEKLFREIDEYSGIPPLQKYRAKFKDLPRDVMERAVDMIRIWYGPSSKEYASPTYAEAISVLYDIDPTLVKPGEIEWATGVIDQLTRHANINGALERFDNSGRVTVQSTRDFLDALLERANPVDYYNAPEKIRQIMDRNNVGEFCAKPKEKV